MKAVGILLFALVSIAVHGQDLLKPGPGAFETKWVKNDSYTMTWYAIRDTSKLEVGRVTTTITSDKENIIVTTRVDLKNRNSTWIDSTIAEKETLKPVYHSSFNIQRDMVLNFGRTVTGYYNDKATQKSNKISDVTSQDYFDSNIYPTLLRWLPLADGYHRDISIYDYNPSGKIGVIKAYVKNVQSGNYESLKSGSRKVWILTVSDEIGNGGDNTSTYFIDKENRKLWKQEILAGQRKMVMQLAE